MAAAVKRTSRLALKAPRPGPPGKAGTMRPAPRRGHPRPLRPVSQLPATSAPVGSSGRWGAGRERRRVPGTSPRGPPGKGAHAGGRRRGSQAGGRRGAGAGAAGRTGRGANRESGPGGGRDRAAPRGAPEPARGRPAFSCKAAGAGRARGRGLSPPGSPPSPFRASPRPGTHSSRQLRAGPGRGRRGSGERSPARWPGHRAPPPPAARSGRAPRAPPEEAKVCRPRPAARAEGSRGPLASRYCSPTSLPGSAAPSRRRPGPPGAGGAGPGWAGMGGGPGRDAEPGPAARPRAPERRL